MTTYSKLKTTVDPRFFLPEGIIDARPANQDETKAYRNPEFIVEQEPESLNSLEIASGAEPGTASVLSAPNFINIVSQVVRFTSDGSQVVDVTIEVEDVIGAENYDIRMTKT